LNGNYTLGTMTDEEYWTWRAEANAYQADLYRQPHYEPNPSVRRIQVREYQDTVVYCLMRARQSKQ
jgi:hypothetical protein